LAKCKNQIEKDFVNQNQRVLGIVENLANYHVYYGNANLDQHRTGAIYESYNSRYDGSS
jgi:hypothetical protein